MFYSALLPIINSFHLLMDVYKNEKTLKGKDELFNQPVDY